MVSVPSGNFGNLTAGLIAKRHRPAGPPVSSPPPTSTTPCPTYLESGRYEPRPSVRDGGQRDGRRRAEQLRAHAGAVRRRPRRRCAATSSASPTTTRGSSRRSATCIGGTATCSIRTARLPGWRCRTRWPSDPDAQGVFLATAHPAKFREVVEPAIGQPVPLPPVLADALARPRHSISMPADYAALETS